MSHTIAGSSRTNFIVNNVFKLLRLGGAQDEDFEWDERRQYYDMLWGYYTNDVYFAQEDGGLREVINKSLGNAEVADLLGLYNPVQRVVDVYANVLRGPFGKEIKVDEMVGGVEVNEILLNGDSPVQKIWNWSKLDTKNSLLTKYAACFGSVGLRVVATPENKDRGIPARVRVVVEHPSRIKDIEFDLDGNVASVLLEYRRFEGPLGELREEHEIRELLTVDSFQAWRDEQEWDLIRDRPGGPIPNELGVVPYVLLKHEDTGDDFGLPSVHSSLPILNAINALATHLQIQVHRHVRAKWLVIASGSKPETFDMSDLSIIYVQQNSEGSRPLIEPLISNLSIGEATQLMDFFASELNDRQPELKAVDGKFLAQQSGDSISQLREPAVQRLRLARQNYEAGLISAFRIGLAWGVLFDLWDLGLGKGNQEVALATLNSEDSNFMFNDRDVLPKTQNDLFLETSREDAHFKTNADVSTTGVEDTSRRERLRIRGYNEEEIEKILEESRTEDVIPTVGQ